MIQVQREHSRIQARISGLSWLRSQWCRRAEPCMAAAHGNAPPQHCHTAKSRAAEGPSIQPTPSPRRCPRKFSQQQQRRHVSVSGILDGLYHVCHQQLRVSLAWRARWAARTSSGCGSAVASNLASNLTSNLPRVSCMQQRHNPAANAARNILALGLAAERPGGPLVLVPLVLGQAVDPRPFFTLPPEGRPYCCCAFWAFGALGG